ncbi:MAG: hypothetical protein DCC65_10670 [Planctomycetota bacterium]|nr:MAG: hypothetical protein DCC65_10670 [Planctomycetota bacterium]
MAKNASNKPVHEIRYGSIKAVIWKNETANGVMHNVTVARIYKDGEDWKESNGFGRDDLLILAKALNDAHSWIHAQKAA